MDKQDTKKNHFNSRAYLKAFECMKGSKMVFTTALVKRGDKVVWAEIKNPKPVSGICWISDYFTDFSRGKPDRKTAEERFKKAFEDDWHNILKSLDDFPFNVVSGTPFKKNKIFNAHQIESISDFITLQYKRSPRLRQTLEFSKKQLKKVRRENPRTTLEECRIMVAHQTQIFALSLDQPAVKQFIKNNNWHLIFNQTEIPFITSDAPVVWVDESPRGMLSVPLSPRFGLLISPTSVGDNIVVEDISKEDVEKYNKILMKRALEQNAHFSRLISNDKAVLEKLIKR